MSYTHDLDIDLYEIQCLNDAIVAIDSCVLDDWYKLYGNDEYLYFQIEKAWAWSEKKNKTWDSRKKWIRFVEKWLQRQKEYRKNKRVK